MGEGGAAGGNDVTPGGNVAPGGGQVGSGRGGSTGWGRPLSEAIRPEGGVPVADAGAVPVADAGGVAVADAGGAGLAGCERELVALCCGSSAAEFAGVADAGADCERASVGRPAVSAERLWIPVAPRFSGLLLATLSFCSAVVLPVGPLLGDVDAVCRPLVSFDAADFPFSEFSFTPPVVPPVAGGGWSPIRGKLGISTSGVGGVT